MKNRPDRSDVLRQIPCPVLFIIGKLDGAIPWENSMAQTHLPAVADIHILEKVGHMGMFEATKQTQGIVRQFVQFCQNQ
jgi:pimeloyl-ACP methyl ester carboxylesterase